VLVGFADALAAPEAAASLLGAGHRVVSFSRRGRAVALRRLRGVEIVEVTAPEEDFAACAAQVGALAAAHDLTMPLDDQAVLVCDRALPVNAPVAGPRGAQAELALDKRLQLRSATQAGLEVPAWLDLDAQEGLPAGWEPPVMLKPALAAEVQDGRLVRFAPRLVASAGELEQLRRSWGPATPAILQRWVRGGGCGVFGLAHGGVITHLSAHRRVRMMNPAGSGSSACVSTLAPESLTGPIERMLAAAEWRGMFMVELLRAGDTWWFMELNGRPWGSLALARRLGFEYPAWAVAKVLDEQATLPEPPPYAELLCRHLGRELVHLLFVLRGPGSHAGAWPGRRETLRALLAGDRRTSWYNLAPDMRGVFVEDTWRTVAGQTFRRRRS
jgi:hypothetical protein